MSDDAVPTNDSVDTSLEVCAGPVSDPPWRADLLRQTLDVLRRRRWRRRLAYAAALAACFVAGAGAMWLWRTDPPAPQPIEQAQQPSSKPEPAPKSPDSAPTPPAVALEWQAFDNAKDRAATYRAAGDRYLREDHDPASALRCYRQALDAGNDSDLAVSADDDWL